MLVLARRRLSGSSTGALELLPCLRAPVLADSSCIESRYYLRLVVADKLGALDKIARFLAAEQISIASVLQKERDSQGGAVPLIIVTHEADEGTMQRGLRAMNDYEDVKEDVQMICIESI